MEAGPEVRDGEQDSGGLQVGHEVVGISADRSTSTEATRQGCKELYNQSQQIQTFRIMRSLKCVWKELGSTSSNLSAHRKVQIS